MGVHSIRFFNNGGEFNFVVNVEKKRMYVLWAITDQSREDISFGRLQMKYMYRCVFHTPSKDASDKITQFWHKFLFINKHASFICQPKQKACELTKKWSCLFNR